LRGASELTSHLVDNDQLPRLKNGQPDSFWGREAKAMGRANRLKGRVETQEEDHLVAVRPCPKKSYRGRSMSSCRGKKGGGSDSLVG